ncbi:MAG: hypothetical protein K5790_01865 [Nitrosopumilus sp.]|uniref:hypothetical protein n=1 Tax=Nitrosopumilus sp. TaxID=2024843 RepID=UPI00247D3BB6|nr:hypothetical protein [Nitrosopumilus sp.]MCV0392021.1 hypothetical protein [Nitrosopumilus sp.]
MTTSQSEPSKKFVKIQSEKIFLIGSILTSFGILLVTVGGSWDITNHLLSKPETFFSPPHALMYCGVAISLIGTVVSFIGWKNLQKFSDSYFFPLKIKLIGISLLVGAGPFDFIWHSNFGLDGLLSPPHLTLIMGMFLCSIGGMIGIARHLKINNYKNSLSLFLIVLGVIPVWLSCSGIISSLSLPFSNTDYFQLNPEPHVAFVVATLAYPMLISMSMFLVYRLSHEKFGMMSILGGLFLLIYSTTAIVPNFAIFDSIQFYSLNLIPFVISDVILLFYKSRKSMIFVGGLLGSVFYMVYYPYVMYTFNEVLLGRLVSPSLIYFVYFELIDDVMMITLIPSVIMGILAVFLSKKFSRGILMND